MVNAKDYGGGAEIIARSLMEGLQERGHVSWMAVSRVFAPGPTIQVLPSPNNYHSGWVKKGLTIGQNIRANDRVPDYFKRLSWLFTHILTRPKWLYQRWRGVEDFNFPGSRQILDLVPFHPDIVHLHNLHGGYFDLRYLSELSNSVPVVITLHDEWLYTGHCAYSLDCSRWQIGCGHCPYLDIYPAINRDATRFNWRRKKQIYQQSKLSLVTPSLWLKNRLKESILGEMDVTVIPNGIDLNVFKPPSERQLIRKELGISINSFVILAVVQKWSRFKDYRTVRNAVENLAAHTNHPQIEFLNLGAAENRASTIGRIRSREITHISDQAELAKYYQAADVFLHAANSDNFPTTILESLASGTPVVATSIGGIPEQVVDGETGFLVPGGDSRAMAWRTKRLIDDSEFRIQMGKKAADAAKTHFAKEKMVAEYLKLYSAWIQDWKNSIRETPSG